MYIEPIISKHKIKNNNEYGSARFSTESEINKHFTKEKISNINEVGFPVYYDKNVSHVWFDKETPHYVYLGSSGSGKSVTCVIPMISFIANAKKSKYAKNMQKLCKRYANLSFAAAMRWHYIRLLSPATMESMRSDMQKPEAVLLYLTIY